MLLESATAYLASRLGTSTAIDITYSREGDFGAETTPLKATRGSTPFEGQSDDGIITRIESRDYLIAMSTFPYEAPQSGDIITDGPDRYEVQALFGTQPYRFSDPGRSLLRIHTKRLSPES